MLLNSNQINYTIPCDNDKFLEKEKKDIKKTNSLKIELQEPKEEIMHLLSPNKSNKKISEDDIYKTEMKDVNMKVQWAKFIVVLLLYIAFLIWLKSWIFLSPI